MSGTLALSSLVASLDRAELSELVRSRRIAAPASVKDSLDLAAELLKPESLTQALTLLPREELLLLASGNTGLAQGTAQAHARLRSLGLLGTNDAILPEVTEALTALLSSRGVSLEEFHESPAPAPVVEPDPADTSSWFAAALTITGQAAWVLRDMERSPAKLNRNGDVASAWLRNAEERLAIDAADEVVELLRAADLVTPAENWCVSQGAEWLASEGAERWAELALAAVSLMPVQLREQLASAAPGSSLGPVITDFPRRYPLATEPTFTSIERAAGLWERVGITVSGRFSEAGITAIEHSLAPAGSPPAVFPDLGLPEPATGIYIQPDLSVVVPGPLTARDEAAISAIALPEQLGVASTLRISEATLSEAFHRGMRGDEIRSLIGGLALTGIPQPVEYLITTLSERAGSIVVSPFFGEHGRAKIDFARPELRSTVLVDRRLAHLQLQEAPASDPATRDSRPLLSRLRADHVLAALLDARYPARGGGGILTPADTRQPEPEAHTPESAPASPATRALAASEALIERVLESASDGPTDISRQVTLAIRDRTRLQVTVEIRGEVRSFTIVPVSLAAGRMRALDEAAGVERTLPLDAITEVVQIG
ncbi:helicase-associated domain-containing protein [Leucobacter sp. BZR 635]